MSFEHIAEPTRRVIYSAAYQMAAIEKAEALDRAKALTRSAIRTEMIAKKRAQQVRNLAVGGSLRAMAVFITLADQYDDAVLKRRACERIENSYR